MNRSENDRPPPMVLAFFRWFCSPDFREDLEGDLLERFHNRRTTLGVRKAKWLFAADVLLLFRPGIIRDLNSLTHHKFYTMKRSGWIKLVAMSVLLIAGIISPFLPGPPNRFVIGLSVFGQSAGFFGLLLVPIGIIWAVVEIRNLKSRNVENPNWRQAYSIAIIATAIILAIIGLAVIQLKAGFLGPLLILIGIIWPIVEIRNLRNRNGENPNWRTAYSLAIIATVIIVAIYLLLLVAVFIQGEFVNGSLALVLGALALKKAIAGIKKLRDPSMWQFNSTPFYLLAIPLIAYFTRIYIMEPLSNYSRSMAIERSQVLIAAIEEFKNKEGQYPESIQDLEAGYLKKIPSPLIMGILNFRYHKINDNFSLSFSQWLELGSLEEIVLYDKDNLKNKLTGQFAKYDYSFDLCRVKGAFASYDTGHGYWRYYWVD